MARPWDASGVLELRHGGGSNASGPLTLTETASIDRNQGNAIHAGTTSLTIAGAAKVDHNDGRAGRGVVRLNMAGGTVTLKGTAGIWDTIAGGAQDAARKIRVFDGSPALAVTISGSFSIHGNDTSDTGANGTITVGSSGGAMSVVMKDSSAATGNTAGASGSTWILGTGCSGALPTLAGVTDRTTGNAPTTVVAEDTTGAYR